MMSASDPPNRPKTNSLIYRTLMAIDTSIKELYNKHVRLDKCIDLG